MGEEGRTGQERTGEDRRGVNETYYVQKQSHNCYRILQSKKQNTNF